MARSRARLVSWGPNQIRLRAVRGPRTNGSLSADTDRARDSGPQAGTRIRRPSVTGTGPPTGRE